VFFIACAPARWSKRRWRAIESALTTCS
jgi:hypothetical protein